MAKIEQQKTFRQQVYKPLLAAALAVAGVFNMMSIAIAEGTAAGETISNTATATYEDDNGDVINATSNTVDIVVAKVTGITAVPVGINDVDDGSVEAGDILEYTFEVTNTGNFTTDIFIPGVNGLNANTTDNFTVTKVEVIDSNGIVTLISQADDPATGADETTNLDGTAYTGVDADETFTVRVTGTPDAGTIAGELVSVTLGDVTPEQTANDNSANTQNQLYAADANGNNDDLYTDDPDDEVATEREASAQQDIAFASAVNPLAFVTGLKTAALTTNNPAIITDDQITYNLGVRVESNDPTNIYQPAALTGTAIEVDGNSEDLILVSDAIPEGTVFESVSTPLPTGWQVIYSIVTPTNAPLNTTTSWSRTAPTNLAQVERIGFVRSGTLAAGSEVTGLRFTVVTTSLSANASGRGQVDNIAQVFGETLGVPDAIIYDESGDQSPNNNTAPSNDGTPDVPLGADGIPDGSNYDPNLNDNGVADPAVDGIDTGNNNTGDDTDNNGEVNQVIISPAIDQILNGPQGSPDAVGPTDENDDFTNDSTPVAAGLIEGATTDADGNPLTYGPVSFTNTISNPTAGTLSNVTIEPIAPSQALVADGISAPTDTQYGANGDIPDGTIVKITFNGQTATYTYNSTLANPADPNADPFVLTDSTVTAGGVFKPITVGNILPGAAPIDYDVEVTLPNGTAVLSAVSIPIIAFPDDNPATSAGYTGETTNNITINRVYTGFIELVKTARILAADGSPRFPDAGASEPFVDAFGTEKAAPGEIIEYRIEYRNISTPDTGTGNVALSANNFVITEDGAAGSNNWGSTTTHKTGAQRSRGVITYDDATTGSNPDYTNEPADGVRVDIYTNTVGTVVPDGDKLADGSFSFRREVTDAGLTPSATVINNL